MKLRRPLVGVVFFAVVVAVALGLCACGGKSAPEAHQPDSSASQSAVDQGASDASSDADSQGGAAGATGTSGASGASAPADASQPADYGVPADALVSVADLEALIEADCQVIDVRSLRNYSYTGHIPVAKNIPAGGQFEMRLTEVSQTKTVVLYDQNGEFVGECYALLMDNGYSPDLVRVLDGGMSAWSAAGNETVVDVAGTC